MHAARVETSLISLLSMHVYENALILSCVDARLALTTHAARSSAFRPLMGPGSEVSHAEPTFTEFDAADAEAEIKWLEKGAVVLKFGLVGKPQIVTIRLRRVRAVCVCCVCAVDQSLFACTVELSTL